MSEILIVALEETTTDLVKVFGQLALYSITDGSEDTQLLINSLAGEIL